MSSFQRSLLVCASLVVVLAGIKLSSAIVVPFLLAIFIAIVCSPLVRLMTRFRLPKALAIFMVMLLVVLLGTWLGALLGSSINDFTAQLPHYRQQLTGQFLTLVDLAARFNVPVSVEVLKEQFDPGRVMSLATDMLSGLGAVMANLLLIVLTVVFMLFEASSLPRKLHYALDDPQMRMQQIDRFLESVNRYLAIKTLISLGTGFICGLGLYLLGVDYFILWGVVAFLFNYIPNIGSIIAAVPPLGLALIQLGPGAAATVAGLYVGVNMFMGNVIEPRMMGRGLGLSTLVVFLSLIFWGWLLGSVGMLLSVPLTMIVKIGLESSHGGRWLAALLEGEPQTSSVAINVTLTGPPIRTSAIKSKTP
ncbi:Predicted PurR-regulated permease PerM [Ferrimonas sediminum]|uniref:Predicted PurR-regulated permease PerM n=1 Tax=Ferrimonas sediminum TaxID=718193 RepID=A0A1G8YS09_9GAMM|nr:AI-2E family transporter [Ferrimonas sediminum]SDK04855.1 Predicted PurR-regulated permease PerM [Ferrimonas sediminum]